MEQYSNFDRSKTYPLASEVSYKYQSRALVPRETAENSNMSTLVYEARHQQPQSYFEDNQRVTNETRPTQGDERGNSTPVFDDKYSQGHPSQDGYYA